MTDEPKVTFASTILVEKNPAEAMEALTVRGEQLKEINHQLAEWLTAYGRLRLKYSDELKKLVTKGDELFVNSSDGLLHNKQVDSMGLCTPMWNSVLQIARDEVKYFDSTTRMMGRDMIAPLKLYTRRNSSKLVEMDEIKDIANLISKSEKGNSDSLTQEKTQWSERAPNFFETFENYDYNRLILLKDVFLKFQTDISDVLAVFKKDNEAGIEHVLSFNPNDEIKRYASAVQGKVLLQEVADGSRTTRKSDKLSHKHGKGVEGSGSHDEDHRSRSHSVTSSARAPSLSSEMSSNTVLRRRTVTSRASSRRLSIFKGYRKHANGTSDVAPASPSKSIGGFTNEPLNNVSSASSGRFGGHSGKKERKKRGMRSRIGKFLHHRKRNTEEETNGHSESSESASVANSHVSHASTRNAAEVEPTVAPIAEGQSTDAPKSDTLSKSGALPEPDAAPKKDGEKANSKPEDLEDNESHNQNVSITPQFPAMKPTKRSDSLVSSKKSFVDMNLNLGSAKKHETASVVTAADKVASNSKELEGKVQSEDSAEAKALPAIPAEQHLDVAAKPTASEPVRSPFLPAEASARPPPPIARKHATQTPDDVSTVRSSTERTAPMPPAQRRISTIGLQPARTGTLSNQGTGLSGNVTGGGGLVSGQIIHPSLTQPGLNASVVELFNATYKSGQCVRSNAIGEVAFSYILDEPVKKIPSKINMSLRSKSGKPLPNFVVNTLFLQQNDSDPTSFVVSQPAQINLRTVGGLKYMLNNPEPPLIVQPVWRHEPNKSTVIISLRPSAKLGEYLQNNEIVLSNVLVSVSIQDAHSTSAATKPSGSFNRDKARVTWSLPAGIRFDSMKKEERFIARFITDGIAKESESGIQVRFTINNDDGAGAVGGLNSDLEITAMDDKPIENPFKSSTSLDQEDGSPSPTPQWSIVPTLKTIVAGGYSGHV